MPSPLAWLLAGIVTGYQRTLSPDHGPLKHLHPYGFCRHEPTCSAYAKETLLRRGAVIGSFMALRRVLSCHPWGRLSDAKMESMAKRWASQGAPRSVSSGSDKS